MAEHLYQAGTFFLANPKKTRELRAAKAPQRKTGDLVEVAYSEVEDPQKSMAELAKKPRFFMGREDQVNVPSWAPVLDNSNVIAPKQIPLRPPWLPWRESSLIPAETVSTVKSGLSPLVIRQSGFAPPTDFSS